MSNYTKTEIDDLVAGLSARITTASGTLSDVNTAITAHDSNAEAHKTLFDAKTTTGSVETESGRIDDLNDTIQDLTERLGNLESMSGTTGLKGTLNYSLSGKAGETPVNITFDIKPIDENNPVTYEIYGDGTLLPGLSFDAAAGTISGTPIAGGTATYVVLAKSGSHVAFITISQKFENPDYTPGYLSLNELLAVLRSNDISSLSSQLGVPITIKMADDESDSSRKLTYNGTTYTRAPGSDITDSAGEITLFAWSYGSSTIYTSEVAIFGSDVVGTGESIKNRSGGVIGTLETTPSYMKDYRIMMTSYDTAAISNSNKPTGYVHNARMEFLDIVGKRKYDSDDTGYKLSDIRAYLISNAADGFLRRLPIDIRNFIVPTNIASVTAYNDSTITILSDKVFLPSAWEICGSIRDSYWYQEGTKSLYYPTSYTKDDTRIRYYNGSADYWWTRTPNRSDSNHILYVNSDGYVYHGYTGAINSFGVAPAFVIA